jgi:hypothetical protein
VFCDLNSTEADIMQSTNKFKLALFNTNMCFPSCQNRESAFDLLKNKGLNMTTSVVLCFDFKTVYDTEQTGC